MIGSDGDGLVVWGPAIAHGEAHLDWPQGDWLYYTRGGIDQPSGSRLLNRVDVTTGEVESVTVFKKDNGVQDSGIWRFQIAADTRRAAVRADNHAPEPFGRITALDLASDDGRLAMARSIDRWSCSAGMDPFGIYFMDGQDPHFGVDIRVWQTLAQVESIRWAATESWGPATRDSGDSHYRSGWSANSQNWLCIHLGWSQGESFAARGANQVLIDWANHERIVVTDNAAGSYEFDCAGDFWVLHAPDESPHIVAEPDDTIVGEGGEPAELVVVAGGAAPLRYQWHRDAHPIPGATGPRLSLPAVMGNDGAAVHCTVRNAAGVIHSRVATLNVVADTEPPTLARASSTGSPTTARVTFSEPVAIDSAETATSYTLDPDIAVRSAQLSADPTTVVLTTSALQIDIQYTLTVNDVTDRSSAANPIAEGATIGLRYTPGSSENLPPAVAAGEDGRGRLGVEHLLDGQVTDDGLPTNSVTVVWSRVSGPADATFNSPERATTLVTFDAVGEYVLRLTADDGEAVAIDQLTFTAVPAAYVRITRPVGGETWLIDTPQQITWESDGFDDVRIDYSNDFGATWQRITESVDVSSPHWQVYPWQTPPTATANALVRISDYFNQETTTSGVFVVAGPRSRYGPGENGCACTGGNRPPTQPIWIGALLATLLRARARDSRSRRD